MSAIKDPYAEFMPMAATKVAPGANHPEDPSAKVTDVAIPVFDLKDPREGLSQAFGEALCDVGFLAIKAEEITPIIDKVNALMRSYFEQPLADKMRDDHHNHYQTGYWPQGLETAAGSKLPDNKETYFVPPHYDRWPVFARSAEFKAVIEEYQQVLTSYAERCMGLIAQYLGEPAEEFSQSVHSGHNLLRLAHYFATNSDAPRAGAHYDLNCITLLPPATGPGLQLRDKAGQWRAISVQQGYLIVNTGEQLQKKTAGVIQATLHRVAKPEGEEAAERFASIFFASLPSEFPLTPSKSCVARATQGMSEAEGAAYLKQYPDVTVLENLLSRLIEMGSIPDVEESLVKRLHGKGLLKQPPQFLKDKYPDLFPL